MRNRVVVSCLLAILTASTAQAFIELKGSMDAEMSRGETKTFEVKLEATNFSASGQFIITITASAGLVLGATTIAPPLPCQKQPFMVRCSGDSSVSPSAPITIRQEITVDADALALEDWTIQISGADLSSGAYEIGLIKVSGGKPKVIMERRPRGILLAVGQRPPAFPDAFDLENVGDAPTTVTMTVVEGPFVLSFDAPQLVLSFAPGSFSIIAVRPTASEEGVYAGKLSVTGNGVDPELQDVPLGLTITKRPGAAPSPQPEQPRKYVGHTATEKVTDSVKVTNSGTACPPGGASGVNQACIGEVRGVLTSDSPWLIPQEGLIVINPGETKDLSFTIDPAQRPDPTLVPGSVEGNLTLEYLLPESAQKRAIEPHSHVPGTASVNITVVATTKTTVSTAGIPPIGESSAVFVPNVGRKAEGNRLFITDLSLYSELQEAFARPLANVDLYYLTPGSATAQKATLSLLLPPQTVGFGDIVQTIFGASEQTGTVMIHAPFYVPSWIIARANRFDVLNRAGTLGSSLPGFLSFTGVDQPGQKIHLTGLRKDANTSLQVFVQEMSGHAAKADLDVRNSTGVRLTTASLDIPAYGLVQVSDASLPAGSATTVISPAAGSGGTFQAFGLQTDTTSGDSWTVVDWVSVRFIQPNTLVIVPVAGATPGANGTDFRTDLTITNVGTASSGGEVTYYGESGEKIVRNTATLAPFQSITYTNVTATLFGLTKPNIGYLRVSPGFIAPTAGIQPFAVHARNYSVSAGRSGAFSTEIPLASFGPCRQRIGGIDDASIETVAARHPGTFRSNFGIMEVRGKPVTVKVTLHYRYPATKVEFTDSVSKTYELGPEQFLFLTKIARELIGPDRRDGLGDLRNMAVDFDCVSGEGRTLGFVSSIDNSTGDSIFRIE